MEYIAFIHQEDDTYVAVIPDLNYTSSFGDSFVNVVHNIVEAGELYCEDLNSLPKAKSLEVLKKENEEKNAIPQLVNLKIEKNVRVNVMLKYDILQIANEKAKEIYNGNRSAYIQSLIESDNTTILP